MPKLFLKNNHLKILQNIFNELCPKAIVWAYGSRVKNEAHSGSDLDLAIQNIDILELGELKEAVNESNIPFLVDILDFEKLPQSFQEEIEKNKVEIFPDLQ